MSAADQFTHDDPELKPIFDLLGLREPIFPAEDFTGRLAVMQRAMSPDDWEVGASGRRCGRDFILALFRDQPPVLASIAGLGHAGPGASPTRPGDFSVHLPAPYRESASCGPPTIGERTAEGWRILYHQGTIVSAGANI